MQSRHAEPPYTELRAELRAEPPYAELHAEPPYAELRAEPRAELRVEPPYAELRAEPPQSFVKSLRRVNFTSTSHIYSVVR